MRDEGDQHCDGGHPAVEQMYDELLARLWALRSVSVSLCPGDASVPPSEDVIRVATAWVNGIVSSERSPVELLRVLWPCSPPPLTEDLWWRTPLGELLDTARTGADDAAVDADQPSDRVAAVPGGA